MIIINSPVCKAKEAVIFEQFGQLTKVTAYLHIHIEFSISSVEAQLVKYHELLRENCSDKAAVQNYMLAYMNSTTFNVLKEVFRTKPEDLPEKSMVRQNAKL